MNTSIVDVEITIKPKKHQHRRGRRAGRGSWEYRVVTSDAEAPELLAEYGTLGAARAKHAPFTQASADLPKCMENQCLVAISELSEAVPFPSCSAWGANSY